MAKDIDRQDSDQAAGAEGPSDGGRRLSPVKHKANKREGGKHPLLVDVAELMALKKGGFRNTRAYEHDPANSLTGNSASDVRPESIIQKLKWLADRLYSWSYLHQQTKLSTAMGAVQDRYDGIEQLSAELSLVAGLHSFIPWSELQVDFRSIMLASYSSVKKVMECSDLPNPDPKVIEESRIAIWDFFDELPELAECLMHLGQRIRSYSELFEVQPSAKTTSSQHYAVALQIYDMELQLGVLDNKQKKALRDEVIQKWNLEHPEHRAIRKLVVAEIGRIRKGERLFELHEFDPNKKTAECK